MSEIAISAKNEKTIRSENSQFDLKTLTQVLIIPILLLGTTQLINTLIPVMYGPSDTSDFSIIAEPPSKDMDLFNNTVVATIIVEDAHEHIRPYGHSVHLYSARYKGFNLTFSPNDKKPPFKSKMIVIAANPRLEIKESVKIEGLGGDGRHRNTTFLIDITGQPYYSETTQPIRSGIPLNSSESTLLYKSDAPVSN